MRKLLFCTALLIAATANAESLFRGSIRGVVCDTEAYPLPAATITITSANLEFTRTVMTDWYGRFNAEDLPAGDDYVVKVEMVGFHPAVKRRIKLAPGAERGLKMRLYEIEPVQLVPPPAMGTFPITPEMEKLPM